MDDGSLKKKKKHKKKLKHNSDKEDSVISETVSTLSDNVSPDMEEKYKKQKKKSKNKAFENGGEIEILKINTSDEYIDHDESYRKKKKRKHHNENEVNLETCAPVNTNELESHDENHLKKKKHKKRKHDSDTSEYMKSSVENTDEIEHSEKKKRKKKKHLDENDDNLEETTEELEVGKLTEVDQQMKKKKKKKNKKKDKDSETADIDQTKDQMGIIQGINDVNGFGNEIGEEVSKEKISNNINTDNFTKLKENELFKSGQWSSVELGDSDRQNKFFRLLGGFKKGSDASQIQNKFSLGKKPAFGSANNTPRRTGGNFAMNKKQEDIYTKALESEYDRAMSMNLNRGIGLGFEKPPEEGKKFYIDTKSSKSIKFND